MSADRRLISSGSPFEKQAGYSRAVAVGPWCFVAGTTGYDYATMSLAEGTVAQCERAMRNLDAALREAGASFADVVRVRYILPNRADFEACWPTLRRCFAEARPAATMIQAGLIDEAVLFEIEATARFRR